MKPRLLEFLRCADCRAEALELTVYDGDEKTVAEGVIGCARCGSRFPIINGVPRMLPAPLRPHLVSFHPDFFTRHPQDRPSTAGAGGADRVVRTLHGYSYQHVQLKDREREIARWRENFLASIPVGPEFFQGQVGADIGCGSGRHLYWAHEFGAEVIGVDLSEGVEVASANTAGCPRSHVVQGDIYHLPLRNGVLDFAYSIGVLHHLPRPRDGFGSIVPPVKRGGTVFIWVYGLGGMRWWYRLSHMTWLRGIGVRLPRWAQYGLSVVLAALLELVIWAPCRVAAAFPGGESIVARVPLGDASRRAFGSKIRSVFDRIQPPVTHYHTAGELEGWLSEHGLAEAAVLNRDGRGWIARGVKR